MTHAIRRLLLKNLKINRIGSKFGYDYLSPLASLLVRGTTASCLTLRALLTVTLPSAVHFG